MTSHVFITGFVQGVGYRGFIREKARKLGLTGWVKNLADNRVEAIFQGPKEQIDQIIKICEKGPFLSEVKDMEVVWENINEDFESFEIVM